MRIAHLGFSSHAPPVDLSGMSRHNVLWALVGLVLGVIATVLGFLLAG
jgi:hypothetical protein